MLDCSMYYVPVGAKLMIPGQDGTVWLKIKTLQEFKDERYWDRNVVCIETKDKLIVPNGSVSFIRDSERVLLLE